MGEPQRKPDFMEAYVVSDTPGAPMIAAMGAACATIAAGDQDERIPIAAAVLKSCGTDADVRAAQLCPMLWRVQKDDDPALLHRTERLLAVWMTGQNRFAQWTPSAAYAERLEPFAARLLHEWLHLRCGKCGGSGRLQVTARGAVRTLGTNARNTKFTNCDLCHGLGHAQPRPAEQAHALGIGLPVFDQAGWHGHFRAGRAWLMKLLRRPRRHLRRELGLL